MGGKTGRAQAGHRRSHLALFGLGSCVAEVPWHEAGHPSIWWTLASLAFVGLTQEAVASRGQAFALPDVPLVYAGIFDAILQNGQQIEAGGAIAIVPAATFSTLAVRPADGDGWGQFGHAGDLAGVFRCDHYPAGS